MKGVLLQRLPGSIFLDLSHEVQPQCILQAGFLLRASWPYLPAETICLAVVDPGVGTDRRILCLHKQGRSVLAPDNGLLGQLLAAPGENRIFDVSPKGIDPQCSATFHGRDLFAPLAADLVQGTGAKALGQELHPEDLLDLELPAARSTGSAIQTQVVHIDRFGNCLLNMPIPEWSPRFDQLQSLSLLLPEQQIHLMLVKTYAFIPGQSYGLLQGSQGVYELACNQTSCAEKLEMKIGDQVTFRIEG